MKKNHTTSLNPKFSPPGPTCLLCCPKCPGHFTGSCFDSGSWLDSFSPRRSLL